MAQQEGQRRLVITSAGEPIATFTRRDLGMLAGRAVVGIIALAAVAEYRQSVIDASKQAAATAAAENPLPSASPTAAPEVVAVARKLDSLYVAKQTVQNEQTHIETGPLMRTNDIARTVLEQEKQRQLKETQLQIDIYKSSPEYQNAMEGYIQGESAYESQISTVQSKRQEETAQLEQKAGVTWVSKAISALSIPLGLFGTLGLTFGPNIFQRPSFPFREEPTQTSQTTQTSTQE